MTFLNQKGGVGKTSTVFHLAGALLKLGKRVLVADLDPQASLTQGFWSPEEAAGLAPQATVAAIFSGAAHYPSLLLAATAFAGIDILRGSALLTEWNVPRPWDAPLASQEGLGRFLGTSARGYDLVLVDCPPNLHLCSWAALAAADAVVVPLQPEDFGAQGIAAVRESVDRVQSGINPGLADPHYLLTMVDRRLGVHQLYQRKLAEAHGAAVMTARIPRAAAFAEAILARKPVGLCLPRSAAAKAMTALAEELLARLARPPIRKGHTAAAAGKGGGRGQG